LFLHLLSMCFYQEIQYFFSDVPIAHYSENRETQKILCLGRNKLTEAETVIQISNHRNKLVAGKIKLRY